MNFSVGLTSRPALTKEVNRGLLPAKIGTDFQNISINFRLFWTKTVEQVSCSSLGQGLQK